MESLQPSATQRADACARVYVCQIERETSLSGSPVELWRASVRASAAAQGSSSNSHRRAPPPKRTDHTRPRIPQGRAPCVGSAGFRSHRPCMRVGRISVLVGSSGGRHSCRALVPDQRHAIGTLNQRTDLPRPREVTNEPPQSRRKADGAQLADQRNCKWMQLAGKWRNFNSRNTSR